MQLKEAARVKAVGGSECVEHVHRLGRTPVWLELSEPRGEWRARQEMEAQDCRPAAGAFIPRAVGRDWKVGGKVVIGSGLF